jgi:hypothetical protein
VFRSRLVWGGVILVAAALLADDAAAAVAMAETPVEEWVANRLASEQAADLKGYPCPGAANNVDCRALSGVFVARLIAGKVVPPDRWPVGGIELLSAEVRGNLDLTGAHVPGRIVMQNSRVAGTVTLDNARFDNSLLLACNRFDDTVTGDGLHVAGDLSLAGSQLAKQISFVGANIGGFFRAGSHVVQRFDASNAHIGLTFAFVQPPTCPGDLSAPLAAEQGIAFDGADVGGNVWIEGRIGHLGSHDAVSAYAAHIHGMVGLQVIADGGIDLTRAVIDNSLSLESSTVGGALKLLGGRIGTDVALSPLAFEGVVDLSGASVGQTFNMQGPPQPAAGGKVLRLNLQNAHVARLQDDAGTWSQVHHQLAGFVYDEFVPPDPGKRPDQGWRRGWLAADESETKQFDPQPYRQLAAVLAASGDKEKATEVAFWSRQRERQLAWQNDKIWTWLDLSVLAFTVGYGIGAYTFVVLIWVVLITVCGTIVLRFSPVARAKGWLWCGQAGLDRLLPIIQLSPEFDNFFGDPEKSQLNRWQVLFFSLTAIIGWLLGAFLAAALSGLTQGSS